jgi:hypothetical protein
MEVLIARTPAFGTVIGTRLQATFAVGSTDKAHRYFFSPSCQQLEKVSGAVVRSEIHSLHLSITTKQLLCSSLFVAASIVRLFEACFKKVKEELALQETHGRERYHQS